MGIKRIVDVQFWNDDKVLEYFSPEDKLFMLYLMTNPHTTQLGIYPINKKHMSFELGYTIDVINVLLDRFENKYEMIKYSNETKEIAIKNYLKHSIIKGGKPVEDCLMKEIKQVKDKSLLGYVYSNIKECETLNDTVKKVIESLNEYDNDNDNDNEDTFTYREPIVKTDLNSVSDEYQNIKEEILGNKENADKICEWCDCKTTVLHKHHYPIPKRLGGKEIVNICSNCHNEFHVREGKKFGSNHSNLDLPKQSKKVKKSYGEYKRVKLTDKEYEKLCEDFDKSFIDNQITLLDEYVESNNNKNKYSNFNLVLRKSIKDNWFKKNTPTRKEIIPKWLDKEIEENTATDEEIAELERYMKRDSKSLEDRVAALQERIGQK